MNNQVRQFGFGTREPVRWSSSDDTEIEGVLYKPHDFDPNQKYPLLVIIHGGRPELPCLFLTRCNMFIRSNSGWPGARLS